MIKIIGFAGKAGSGKTTASRAAKTALAIQFDLGLKRFSFAGALKDATRMLFGFREDQLRGPAKEVPDPFWGLTPRDVLQRFGTEAMRGTFGPDFWVRVAERAISSIDPHQSSGLTIVLIDDVRYPEEVAFIARQGTVVHITRPDRTSIGAGEAHISETALDRISWPIDVLNNVGVHTFKGQIADLCLQLVRDWRSRDDA